MKINWISSIFIALTQSSSRLRQVLWRYVYNKLALRDEAGTFIFMNYGYDDKKSQALSLKEQDEPFRYFIQLYYHVVQELDLNNKDVLEVGCGRGGGGSFLLRYKHIRTYIGVDLSDAAIDWCQRQYQFTNADWLHGFSDAIPVSDNSIDVVVNVESSHCYPSMETFLREVRRVLRVNGYLAFCDLRHVSSVAALDANIHASGLRVVKRCEITPQVLNALNRVSEVRDSQISSIIPAIFRQAGRDFAAVKNTAVYNMLKTGQMKYLCYLLQKESSPE